MNRLSHQPRALLAAITIGLGFAMVGAGCTQGNDNAGKTSSMAGATTSGQSVGATGGQHTASGNNNSGLDNSSPVMGGNDDQHMGAGNDSHANNASAGNDNDEHMGAGVGDSHEPVKDTWITTKVLGVLQTVKGLDNTDLGVETNDGVVVLTGSVASQKTLDDAIAEIKTVEGVKSVDTSRLDIGSGQ